VEVINMRATLNIPDELIEEVQNMAGVKSKTQAIVVALQEYARKKRLEKLLQLRGNINIDYNWEKEEEIEMKSEKTREYKDETFTFQRDTNDDENKS
jgi:hypothetical protein